MILHDAFFSDHKILIGILSSFDDPITSSIDIFANKKEQYCEANMDVNWKFGKTTLTEPFSNLYFNQKSYATERILGEIPNQVKSKNPARITGPWEQKEYKKHSCI